MSREAKGAASGRGDPTDATVVALAEPKAEARRILDEVQYCESVAIVKRLSEFGNPSAVSDLSIRKFGDFWELRLKGGFLKRVNLRIYFAYVAERREVVILKAYKKEEDRRVCPSVRHTLEDRLEDYLAGKVQDVSRYKRRD